MTEIILQISRLYQVKPCDLLSKSRKMPLPQARHRLFSLAWANGYRQALIAELFSVSPQAVSAGISNHFQTN